MIDMASSDHDEGGCLDGGAGHTYIYGRARHSVDGRRASFLGAGNGIVDSVDGILNCVTGIVDFIDDIVDSVTGIVDAVDGIVDFLPGRLTARVDKKSEAFWKGQSMGKNATEGFCLINVGWVIFVIWKYF